MRGDGVMGLREWVLLLLLSLLWGGSFFFSKLALSEWPPLAIVLARVALAAVALGLYLRATGHPLPRGRIAWSGFFGMGLLNNLLPFGLLLLGQTRIASGLASILNATTPIFAIAAAHLFTADEALTPRKIAGTLLGIAGVAVLTGGLGAAQADPPPLWAVLACLAAACSYGLASVFGRRFRRLGIPPVSVAFGQTAASSLMALPLVLLVDPPGSLPLPSLAVLLALLGLGLLSTALAYVLFFRILAAGGAVNASLVTLLIPVSAILLGDLILGERLPVSAFLGMGLIGLGLLVIDGRLLAAWRSQGAV